MATCASRLTGSRQRSPGGPDRDGLGTLFSASGEGSWGPQRPVTQAVALALSQALRVDSLDRRTARRASGRLCPSPLGAHRPSSTAGGWVCSIRTFAHVRPGRSCSFRLLVGHRQESTFARAIEDTDPGLGRDVSLRPGPTRRSLPESVEQDHSRRPRARAAQVDAMTGDQVGATPATRAQDWG